MPPPRTGSVESRSKRTRGTAERDLAPDGRPARLNPSLEDGARGTILARFSTTEAVIDAIVSSYYFGDHKPPREFQEDLLFDESFSFALQRSVFEKILKREGLYDEKAMQAIRHLNKLRNLAAHCRGERFDLVAGAWECVDVANKVERFLHHATNKLGIRLHGDPLPTRKELMARGTS